MVTNDNHIDLYYICKKCKAEWSVLYSDPRVHAIGRRDTLTLREQLGREEREIE